MLTPLDLLRSALVEYLTALPRTSRTAYGNADVQALLNAFIERFREFTLPSHVRTLAFSARDARNEIAHYVGAMAPDVALRHLLNIRQLLKDLGTQSAFVEVDRLYNEQLRSLRTQRGCPQEEHRSHRAWSISMGDGYARTSRGWPAIPRATSSTFAGCARPTTSCSIERSAVMSRIRGRRAPTRNGTSASCALRPARPSWTRPFSAAGRRVRSPSSVRTVGHDDGQRSR